MSPVLRLLTLILLAPALAGGVKRPTNPNQTHQGTISPLILTLLAPILAIPAAIAQVSYLESETFALPTNGTDVASMKLLDPSARYRLQISSHPFWRDNLAPLELMRFSVKNGVATMTTDFGDPQVELWSGIVINGKLARTRNYAQANYSDRKNLTVLEFELQGTARPLTLNTIKNFSATLSTLRVDVWRLKPEPPPPPSTPQQANNPNPRSFPLLFVGLPLGVLVMWRAAVYMRRRQLRVTLRHLLADIKRVERARSTLNRY